MLHVVAGNESLTFSPIAHHPSTAIFVIVINRHHIKSLTTYLEKVCGLLLLEMEGHTSLIMGIRASHQNSTTLCRRCRARVFCALAPDVTRETAYHCGCMNCSNQNKNIHRGSRLLERYCGILNVKSGSRFDSP